MFSYILIRSWIIQAPDPVWLHHFHQHSDNWAIVSAYGMRVLYQLVDNKHENPVWRSVLNLIWSGTFHTTIVSCLSLVILCFELKWAFQLPYLCHEPRFSLSFYHFPGPVKCTLTSAESVCSLYQWVFYLFLPFFLTGFSLCRDQRPGCRYE